MVKIIVAFASDEKCMQYSSVLEEAGIPVFRKCTSASEVKRTLNQCGDGIIIASCRLPDSTIDALAWDLGKQRFSVWMICLIRAKLLFYSYWLLAISH